MILDVLAHKDYLRILLALEHEPLRFTEIQKALDLNPTQVDRGLKALQGELWVVPKTIPSKSGPIRVEYRLGKRGAAFLESFEKFRADLKLREPELGRDEVKELQSLSV